MVYINILGDFCVRNLNGLTIGDELQGLLDKGDINVLNFEAPVFVPERKPILKSGPSLFQDPNSPDFLRKHGFNIFTLANNHIMDYGYDAFVRTKEAFGDSVILGCGSWDEAYECKFLNINNIKIGFLALTQYEFGVLVEENYDKYGTSWVSHPCVDELILEAKTKCDFLILLPHIGLEHFDYPLPELKTLYRHFINIGADAVIGNHPHVPQPWELFNDSPIVYSLGNFVFDSIKPMNKWWFNGIMAQLMVTKGEKVRLCIHKVMFDKDIRKVDSFEDDNFDRHLILINNVFKDTKNYMQNVNRQCLELEFLYDYQFERGGYIRPNIRKYLKAILLRLKEKLIPNNRFEYNPAYYINNIRCEPHRWVISRIYELKNNIKNEDK